MPITTAATRHDSLSGLLRVLGAAIVWGTIPLALHATEGAPTVKVFYRVIFAGAALGLYAIASGRLGEFRMSWRQLRMLIVQGLLLTLNWFLFFGALDRTTVATAELLGYTGPIFVAAFAPFVSKEPFEARIFGPIALALAGIAVILIPQGLSMSTPRELLGAGMAFASALTYSTLLLRAKRILRNVATIPLMVVEYTVASIVLLPAALTLPGPSSAGGFAAAAYLGLITTAATGLMFISGLRRVRTDHAAVLTYAEPVSALLFAAAFLGEPLTAYTLIGAALVVAAGAMTARMTPTPGIEVSEATSEGDDIDGTPSAAAERA